MADTPASGSAPGLDWQKIGRRFARGDVAMAVGVMVGRKPIAGSCGGTALFPSDGPPYPPFQRWAQATGRIWQSPAGLLVHAEAGLWVSFRGALALPFDLALPPAARPCDSCAGKPCLNACPVGALGAQAGGLYDVPRCHDYLARPEGQGSCMARGCGVRRACPLSQSHARLEDQSAYHMRQFHR